MCGIIGYLGTGDAIDLVMEGLKRLEYRGYDSAGIAYRDDTKIKIKRCKGKIKDLEKLVYEHKPFTNLAIGHTRWATHGVPSEYNAHPHVSNSIVLVHNGIIENYIELRSALIEEGYQFSSETDTEVLCHLIDKYHSSNSFEDSVRMGLKEVKGAYAIVVLSLKEPHLMVGARKDSPLVLGLGKGEFFLASDAPAFLSWTREVIFLHDNDIVTISINSYKITNMEGNLLEREKEHIPWDSLIADRGNYKHFMSKEIHEQPRAIADTLCGRIFPERGEVNLDEFGLNKGILESVKKVFIGACGTSWHAALVGKYMLEQIARVPVEVEFASEFRYRDPLIGENNLFIAITQSGETADTLAAQREAKRRGALTLSICNALGATSAREADAVFYTHSGPEIGVASTKAFTSQIVSLYLLTLAFATAKNTLIKQDAIEMVTELMKIPDKIKTALEQCEEGIKTIAKDFIKTKDFLYLGRGILYPIALEGALKLKEISYVHAEGYPAGEMKHGPIALIDEEVPVVFLVQQGPLREKIYTNISEIKTRGGKVIAVMSHSLDNNSNYVDYSIKIPNTNQFLESILMAVPLQLFAYYMGVLRGCDVDQPRNLAKSVTVE